MSTDPISGNWVIKGAKAAPDPSLVTFTGYSDDNPTAGDTVTAHFTAAEAITSYYWEVSTAGMNTWIRRSRSDSQSITLTGAHYGLEFRINWYAGGTLRTAPTTFIVQRLPAFAQYSNTTPGPGDTVTATFSATIGATFQWQSRADANAAWENMSDAFQSTSLLVPADAAEGTQYRIAWHYNGMDNTASSHVTLTFPDVTFSAYSDSSPIPEGTIVANFSSMHGATFQWQSREDSNAAWSDIAGQTETSYRIPAGTADGRQYRIAWTFRGTTRQATAVSTVTYPEVSFVNYSTSQPTAGTRLTATFTSLLGVTFQWQYRVASNQTWQDADDGTGQTIIVPNAAGEAWQYRITWTFKGTTYQATAVADVTYGTLVLNSISDEFPNAGDTVTANFNTTDNVRFVWHEAAPDGGSPTIVTSATTNVLTIPADAAPGTIYRLEAGFGASGSLTTYIGKLTVHPATFAFVSYSDTSPNPGDFLTAVFNPDTFSPIDPDHIERSGLQWQSRENAQSLWTDITTGDYNQKAFQIPTGTPAGTQLRITWNFNDADYQASSHVTVVAEPVLYADQAPVITGTTRVGATITVSFTHAGDTDPPDYYRLESSNVRHMSPQVENDNIQSQSSPISFSQAETYRFHRLRPRYGSTWGTRSQVWDTNNQRNA